MEENWHLFSEFAYDPLFKIHFYFDEELLLGVATTNTIWRDWGIEENSSLNGAHWLGNLEVNKNYKGKGIGTEILNSLTSEGKWVLEAYPHNFKFYLNRGFVDSTPSLNDCKVFLKGFKEEDVYEAGDEWARLQELN